MESTIKKKKFMAKACPKTLSAFKRNQIVYYNAGDDLPAKKEMAKLFAAGSM